MAGTRDGSWRVAPYLLVKDVAQAAAWYRDRLGFTFERLWGEPPSFVMVNRGGVTLMLKQPPGGTPGLHVRPNAAVNEDCCWDAYLWVDDADALHREFTARGVELAEDIGDRFYGCRDFTLIDGDGYRLCFGHDLGAKAKDCGQGS